MRRETSDRNPWSNAYIYLFVCLFVYSVCEHVCPNMHVHTHVHVCVYIGLGLRDSFSGGSIGLSLSRQLGWFLLLVVCLADRCLFQAVQTQPLSRISAGLSIFLVA